MKKLLVCFTLLMLTSATCYAQLNTNRIMQIGRNALYYEDYVLSIQYFNRVINVKPYLAEPYYYRAIAKYYLDDISGACNDCDIALGINPFMLGAYNLRGIIRLRQNKSADALDDFTKGLDIEPDNFNLLMNSGIANINLKEYDKAIENYDKLLRYDKRNISAILYRGIALVNKGDSIKGLEEFSRAADMNNYSADAFTYKGMLLYQLKRYDEALSAYNHLQELRPQDANVYINRAITRYNLDDLKGCFADLDEAIKLDPKNMPAYANRGMLRAEVGDLNNAIEDFSKVLALNPADDIALFNRANLYIQTGDMRSALNDLNIIITKHPEFGQAYYQRAIVKRQQGDIKGSELDFTTAYTFEQERIKRGLEAGKNTDSQEEPATDDIKQQQPKKTSRSKNDNDIKKYNQMVVVADFGDNDDKLQQESEKEIIRGRVQDRDIVIDLEPVFELSFFSSDTVLPKARYYEPAVEMFNSINAYQRPLSITNRELMTDKSNTLTFFNDISALSDSIDRSPNNYSLFMVRGSLYNLVMNYNNAISDFNVCILKDANNVIALFNRAATRYKMVEVIRSLENDNALADAQISGNKANNVRNEIMVLDYDLILADLNNVINIAPDFEFAYYNKALVQCSRKLYNEALSSLDKAIEINADFAEAYFNRGIIRLYLGNEAEGEADLSKAGELGIFKAYNVIKRYTGKTTSDNDNDQ